MADKLLNAGQTCIAPDHALIPRERMAAFIAACRVRVGRHYPHSADTPGYSAVINPARFIHLAG